MASKGENRWKALVVGKALREASKEERKKMRQQDLSIAEKVLKEYQPPPDRSKVLSLPMDHLLGDFIILTLGEDAYLDWHVKWRELGNSHEAEEFIREVTKGKELLLTSSNIISILQKRRA